MYEWFIVITVLVWVLLVYGIYINIKIYLEANKGLKEAHRLLRQVKVTEHRHIEMLEEKNDRLQHRVDYLVHKCETLQETIGNISDIYRRDHVVDRHKNKPRPAEHPNKVDVFYNSGLNGWFK